MTAVANQWGNWRAGNFGAGQYNGGAGQATMSCVDTRGGHGGNLTSYRNNYLPTLQQRMGEPWNWELPDFWQDNGGLRTDAVTDPNNISGSTTLTFAPSGTLNGFGEIAASSTITLSPTGTIAGLGAVSGSTTLTLAPSATASGIGALTGTAPLTLAPSGTVNGFGALTGTTALAFAPSATLVGIGAVTGSTSIVFAPSGTLDAGGGVDQITGSTSISFYVLSAAAEPNGLRELNRRLKQLGGSYNEGGRYSWSVRRKYRGQ